MSLFTYTMQILMSLMMMSMVFVMVTMASSSAKRITEVLDEKSTLHNPEGKNVMLLGLDVLPEYRHQGLAREIMTQYVEREQKRGRECLYLTCLDNKVEMYKKMDYTDNGISGSAWGGEEWHDMSRKIR